ISCANEVAIEDRGLVVASLRGLALPPTAALFPYTTLFRSDRRDIEPVDAWRQTNVQSNNLDHEFGKPEPAPASRSNYRRHCHATSEERTSELHSRSVPVCRLLADKDGILQIVGED